MTNQNQYKSRCRSMPPFIGAGSDTPRQHRTVTVLLLMRVAAMDTARIMAVVSAIPDAHDRTEPRAVGFFQVPAAFIADLPDCEMSTLKVYMALCANANNETKRTFISVPKLAAQTGLCERTVHYALRWLEDRKWIKANRSRTRGDVTRYKIWIHPALTSAAGCTTAMHPCTTLQVQPSAAILNSNSEEPPP